MNPTPLAAATTLFDPGILLHQFGPWALLGLGLIIFIESGALFPLLPGDSLLVTAAVLSQQLHLGIPAILIVAIAAALAGDQLGYSLGRRFGRGLFRHDARVFRTERLEAAESFFERFGAAALVLGRFVPIVRTYVPLAAGTSALPYRRFVLWNAVGATAWVVSMVAAGALLGQLPLVRDHIDVLMVLIVAASLLPVLISVIARRVRARHVPTDGPFVDGRR